MRRVLIISPRFPPTNAPDMHRVRHSLPWFRECGWEPTVLAVDPAQCDAPLDRLLEGTIPADVPVVRTGAIDLRFTRRFGLGNLDLRAMPFVARAGARLLATGEFDLVYFSTTAFSLAALGPVWLRRFRVPFVIDLQDPWWSDYHHQPDAPAPPGGPMKYWLSQRLARVLEPYAMRRVAHVISVSPAYPRLLMGRYPSMSSDRFTVLPFAASESDFELLRRRPVRQGVFDRSDGFMHWVYAGVAGEIMRFSLAAIFSALRSARESAPEVYGRLRLHFVGTDYASGDRARKSVEPIAASYGVGDLVAELPHRVAYFEALQCLLDADALLMPGSDDPGYTASKLYPYIMARKPLLGVFHEQSSVLDVLRRTRAGTAIAFSNEEEVAAVARRIEEEWFGNRRWATPPETDWRLFEQYTARNMTRAQCEVFDRVVRSGPEQDRAA